MKHLHKIKPTFTSIFSLNTDLFEMLDQTLFLVFDLLLQILYPVILFHYKLTKKISNYNIFYKLLNKKGSYHVPVNAITTFIHHINANKS